MGVPIFPNSLAAAVETGEVSERTAGLLSAGASPTASALGVDPEMIRTPKVTLAAVLVDDSSSMSGMKEAIVQAINERLIKPLNSQQTRNDVLLAVTSMWHGVLLPFTRIADLEQFDRGLFIPDGGSTPLYRSIRDTLRLLTEKQGELALSSIGARIMFLTYTDGGENVGDVDESDLRAVVTEIDAKKANALYGIACGSAAREALEAVGFSRISDHSDPVALADAFNQFSRATSAAANE